MSIRVSQSTDTALSRRKREHEQHKDYYKKYNKGYYLNNKDRIIKKQRKYYKEMRKISKELGNCSRCFKLKEDKKFKMCLNCRIITAQKERGRRKNEKEKKE